MKNYTQFKDKINLAIATLTTAGVSVQAKRWTKQSPYQKARYKPEYVFPEVWVYRTGQKTGAVVNGEDVTEKTTNKELVETIKNYLF